MINAQRLVFSFVALVIFMVLRGAGVSMVNVGIVFAGLLGVFVVIAIGIAALHLSFTRR